MIIDILTVAGPSNLPFPGGLDYVQLNLDILKKTNPKLNFRMHVAVLTGDYDSSILRNYKFEIFVYSMDDLSCEYPLEPSNQHGTLLNLLIKDVALASGLSPFFIIIDPDCFLVKHNFVVDSIAEMQDFGLSFFGITYPSTVNYLHYNQDFPTAYFMIVNSLNVNVFELDFRPDESRYHKSKNTHWGCETKIDFFVFPFLRLSKFYKLLNNKNLYVRVLIKTLAYSFGFRQKSLMRDTGWKVRKYAKSKKLKDRTIFGTSAINLKSVFSVEKYLKYGIDLDYYIIHNPDVKEYINPRDHFIRHGKKEGRNPVDPETILEWRLMNFLVKLMTLLNRRVLKWNYSFEIASFFISRDYLPELNYFNNSSGLYFKNSNLVAIHLGQNFKSLNYDLEITKSELQKLISIN